MHATLPYRPGAASQSERGFEIVERPLELTQRFKGLPALQVQLERDGKVQIPSGEQGTRKLLDRGAWRVHALGLLACSPSKLVCVAPLAGLGVVTRQIRRRERRARSHVCARMVSATRRCKARRSRVSSSA